MLFTLSVIDPVAPKNPPEPPVICLILLETVTYPGVVLPNVATLKKMQPLISPELIK